jgi:hypothetical protein
MVKFHETQFFQRVLISETALWVPRLMKWGTKMRKSVFLAAVAAAFVAATPAAAAPTPGTATATAKAKGIVLQPLTLIRSQDLDFGTVVSSAAAGTVVVNADTGARTVTGGVTGVPSFPGGRGLFQGAGAVSQNVQLTLSAPALLISQSNSADTITVNSMVLDSGNLTLRNLGASGVFQVGVGGNFAIAANQPAGLYEANFTLTADYQ